MSVSCDSLTTKYDTQTVLFCRCHIPGLKVKPMRLRSLCPTGWVTVFSSHPVEILSTFQQQTINWNQLMGDSVLFMLCGVTVYIPAPDCKLESTLWWFIPAQSLHSSSQPSLYIKGAAEKHCEKKFGFNCFLIHPFSCCFSYSF